MVLLALFPLLTLQTELSARTICVSVHELLTIRCLRIEFTISTEQALIRDLVWSGQTLFAYTCEG